MKLKPKLTIADYFSDLDDPRVERTKRHQLIDIITIAILAVICGADGWVSIETYGQAKHQWLKGFLDLPNGIPSHDTFSRVFARINPQQFQECFLNWIRSISQMTQGEVVAIDGKTLRHSYDKGADLGAIHMVSAWATTNHLVLGQVKVDKKSNEITAIPELLKVLDLAGCIVTIDAMGCQKDIVKRIAEQEANYVITLKKNQKSLYRRVEQLFKSAIESQFDGWTVRSYGEREVSHGREEIRRYLMLCEIREQVDPLHQWSNLNSVGLVESVRTVNGKTTVETRYYISSLTNDAQLFGQSVRSHWGIENQLHWVLDVAFSEDDCRIRKDNAPQNLAIIRQIALNFLGREKSLKVGVKNKQFRAAMDNNYLLKVLTT
ncbi:MAG: ISAs1 family transposase [Cyanobacteriota bacterium]